MFNKTTNHLGSNIEKMAESKLLIPSLNKQLQLLQEATNDLQHTLIDCLPKEILDNCWVVKLSNTSITLVVNSTTASNHIHYMKQDYIRILTTQSQYFTKITDLRVIVNHN